MSVQATPAHLRAQAPSSAAQAVQAAPAAVPAPQPNSHAATQQNALPPSVQPTAGTWLANNWLMCVVIVLALLLVFIVGYLFFRTPATPAASMNPHANRPHASMPAQAPAGPPTTQTAPPAAEPATNYEELLRRGQAALAATTDAAPAPTTASPAVLKPDETSEEEILKLMTEEPAAQAPPEPANNQTDEKKL